MISIIAEIVKYSMIVLMVLYTLQCFTVFRHNSEKKQGKIFRRQNWLMFLSHFLAYVVIYLEIGTMDIIIFYGAQVIYLIATIILFRFIYPNGSRLVINNMCMLLSIGFIILTRLNYTKASKQFKIIIFSTIIALLVPFLIRKLKFLKSLAWLYMGLGIGLLLVLVGMEEIYGAKIAIQLGSFSIQPAEFVKIVFVFFMASMLYKSVTFKQLAITSVLAAIHVLILVYATDLGAAVIYFIAYLIMVYVASQKLLYLGAGVAGGSIAAVIAHKLFYHVQVRVAAWQNPFASYETGGYQVAQSLFAIGSGGWFGLGLYQGVPESIPIAEEDFIFAAIAEEMGGIYAVCLLLVCMSCFIMFVNISLQIKNNFYKLVAMGLGTIYAFQVFLTVGGCIKFIPSTGVTLPLISYGGSSILSTMIMFSIIQGLYILREDEEESLENTNTATPTEKSKSKKKKSPARKKIKQSS